MAATPKYNQDYHDDWAWSLAAKGATDNEIAEAFGVSVRNVNRWKSKHESFRKKLEIGKEAADAKVEASLYKRACGYSVEESETIVEIGDNGEPKPMRIKRTNRHIQPDTMAAMYWLNNRSRKTGEWAQRQNLDIGLSQGLEDVVIYLPSNGRDIDGGGNVAVSE